MMRMNAKKQMKSKAMIAGWGMVGLGLYLISEGKTDLGIAQIMTGFGIIGIRDASEGKK